jgi:hypothetical protein
MSELIISAQVLNQVLGYLGTRPYQEVFQLIEALQSEARSQPAPKGQAQSEEHQDGQS